MKLPLSSILLPLAISTSPGAQILDSNFDASDGNFIATSDGPIASPWTHQSGSGTWTVQGEEAGAGMATSHFLTSEVMTMPSSGSIEIELEHRFSFEENSDGGVLQISFEDGPFQTISQDTFSTNPYNSESLRGVHQLNGQAGFSGVSPDFATNALITSKAALPFPIKSGQTFQVRLLAVFDDNTLGIESPAWEIGSLKVSTQLDSDSDSLPDAYELKFALNPNDAGDAAADGDNDSLNNLAEFFLGTNPTLRDSDGDRYDDNVEDQTGIFTDSNSTGTDPLNPDTDGDGVLDGVENPSLPFTGKNQAGSNPNVVDTDMDGFDDGKEVLFGTSDPTNPDSRPIRSELLDLLAYWNFNDDSSATVTIDEIHGIEGELLKGNRNSVTKFTVDGGGRSSMAGDKALDLGERDRAGTGVRVELGELLDLGAAQNQIAISYWQKLSKVTQSSAFRGTSVSSNFEGRGLNLHATWIDETFYFDTAGCCDEERQRIFAPADGLNLIGQWHHIVAQKNGDKKEIYVDGILLVSGENSDPLPRDFDLLFIGSGGGFFNTVGQIDDFAVFADALNTEEITALASGADPRTLVPSNTDTDGDLIPDAYENAFGLNANLDDADADLDNDSLSNLTEYLLGTRPNNDDTDGDNAKDGVESNTGIWTSAADTGTDPLNPDSDGDGLKDGVENPDLPFQDSEQTGTDPNEIDSDKDNFFDGDEIERGTDPTDSTKRPPLVEPKILVYYDFDGQLDDQIGNAPAAALLGPAALTEGNLGHSGKVGDESLDLGVSADFAAAFVDRGDHLNPAFENNGIAVSFWQFNTTVADSSAFWIESPGVSTFNRGFQAHTPWGDGMTYVDVAGDDRLSSDADTKIGEWQHFVIQKGSRSDLEIWINGALQARKSDVKRLAAFDGQIAIGAQSINLANSFAGRLDDFAIFSEALSPDLIAALAGGARPTEILAVPGTLKLTSFSYDPTSGENSLSWDSQPDGTYTIQASTDLVNWSNVATNLPATGTKTTFTTTENGGLPEQYFRVIEE